MGVKATLPGPVALPGLGEENRREGESMRKEGERASRPSLTFVKQQLLQGLAPLEGFL